MSVLRLRDLCFLLLPQAALPGLMGSSRLTIESLGMLLALLKNYFSAINAAVGLETMALICVGSLAVFVANQTMGTQLSYKVKPRLITQALSKQDHICEAHLQLMCRAATVGRRSSAPSLHGLVCAICPSAAVWSLLHG